MDRKDRERELVSALLSNLYPSTISEEQMAKGFTRLLLFTEVSLSAGLLPFAPTAWPLLLVSLVNTAFKPGCYCL